MLKILSIQMPSGYLTIKKLGRLGIDFHPAFHYPVIMSAEAGEAPRGELPQKAAESTPPADPYRAFRELQRWLNLDDQGRSYGPPPSRADLMEGTKMGTIQNNRPGVNEPPADNGTKE